MTSLYKLSITGIRSYDPDDSVVIEFFKPLTIILGSNGSGKTTVIECLKYATGGGEPPGGDRGKNWVHDCVLAGRSSIKAKVMLGFYTEAKSLAVVSRAVQVSQVKARREFKTLDSTISLRKAGSNVDEDMTNKCGDANKLVPQLLGVSKPLLDHVIFCHQEDSSWPLEDDRHLKARFDDIFAATRYSKALEHIKTIKKSHSERAKDAKHQVELLATSMESCEGIREEIISLQTRISKSEQSIEAIADRCSELASSKAHMAQLLLEMKEVQTSEQLLKNKIEIMDNERMGAYRRLKHVFEEDDSKLEELVQESDSCVLNMKAIIQELDRQLDQTRLEKASVESNFHDLSRSIGKVELLKEEYSRLSVCMSETVQSLTRRYPVEFNDISDPDSASSTGRSILLVVQERFEHSKSKARDTDSEYESTVSALRSKKDSLTEQIRRVAEEESTLRGKIVSLTRQIDGLEENLGVFEALEEEIGGLEQTKQILMRIDHVDGRSLRCRELHELIRHNSVRLDSLRQKRSVLESQASIMVELDLVRKQLTEEKLILSREEHAIDISKEKTLLGLSVVTVETLSALNVASEVHSTRKTLALTESEITIARQAYIDSKAQYQVYKGTVECLESEINILIDKSRQFLSQTNDGSSALHESMTFLEILARLSSFSEQYSDSFNSASALQRVYQSCESFAETRDKCFICERELTGTDRENFSKLMKKKSNHVQMRWSDPQMLKSIRSHLERMNGSRADYERLQSLRDYEIPSILKAIDEYCNKIKTGEETYETLKAVDVLLEQKSKAIAFLSSKLNQVSRASGACRSLSSRATSLQSSLAPDFVLSELGDLKMGISSLEKINLESAQEIESLRSETDRHTAKLHAILNELQLKRTRLSEGLQEKEALKQHKESLSQLRNEVTSHNTEINALKSELSTISNRITLVVRQRNDAYQRCNDETRILESELETLKCSLYSLESLSLQLNQVRDSIAASGALESQCTNLRETLVELTSNLVHLEERRSSQIAELSSSSSQLDDMKNNLEYRERQKEMDSLVRSRESLLRKLNHISHLSKPELELKLEACSKELEDWSLKSSHIAGQKTAQTKHLEELQVDLSMAKYADIDERFRRSSIIYETTRLSLNDLNSYYEALDKALMTFHGRKLKEVNQVLKELWQMTYRGLDIDHIAIRSDIAGKDTKKQYSYRVVMVQKGSSELPMRGRCSAGQRVLACLLIRMALAETFCVKCGVLALDEPTQNLDRKNIKALAEALKLIITRRKNQSSFQLILITHDEAFAEMLNARDHTDYYYLVNKDQSNFSKISKQPIH